MISTEVSVREQIIETATRLFYDQGYNLTGINQIIEEAGVACLQLFWMV
jgi:AcrR family transcriptional regulator